MVKRLVIAAVGVVGLVVIGLGVASATVWRADDVLVAGTSDGPHTLVTDPGVLELGGDPVTVRVTVPDKGTVTLAVGRDTDVKGWIGTESYGQVTGLKSWHELAVSGVKDTTPEPSPSASAAADGAAAAPAPSPTPTSDAAAVVPTASDPAGSDLWVVQATGKGVASLEWPQQEGRWSLIAVSTGASAPHLTLAWPRTVTTPWLWPAVVVGLLLVLLSVWLLVRDLRRQRLGLDEEWHPVETGAIPTVLAEDVDAIPVLTRRQMREAVAARAARPAAPRTGQVRQVAPPLPDTEVRTATTPVDAPPTSRRALRAGSPQTSPTAAVPTTSAEGPLPSPAPVGPGAAGWTPASPRPSTGPSAPDASAPTGAATGGSAPNGVTPVGSASAGAAPVGTAASTDPDGPHGRPSWLNPAGSTASGAGARSAGPPAQAPLNAPTGRPGSGDRPAASTNPSTGAPTDAATGAPTAPTADGAEPGGSPARGAAAWATVTAPTPAVSSTDAPDPHAGRPAWLATTAHDAPQETAGGSRADAWRRAWGLPPTETPSPQPPTESTDETSEQEDGR
ncbi:hypothetical protein ACPPVS_04175 [Cellulomonas sp. McL0617]|uniref:hypothetical protein n=1 Tax=Cellulomonas sp. McL0617 TaxID=3415675 RepID=UPI003CEE53CC